MAKKRTKADKLQRNIERTDKRTNTRPDENIAKPKQDAVPLAAPAGASTGDESA